MDLLSSTKTNLNPRVKYMFLIDPKSDLQNSDGRRLYMKLLKRGDLKLN